VAYIKSKRDIGNGFGNLNQKKTKIKTQTAKRGMVGVTPEGPAGHLVFVEEVRDNTLIISEGNYRHSFVTWREIPKSLPLGFF